MRTPPMSDEELDALVRRSAEAYPDELPLGAWRQLEDKLEAAVRQQQIRQQVNRKVGQLFVLEMLLVGLVGLWWQGNRLAASWPPQSMEQQAAAPPTAAVLPEAATPAVPPGPSRVPAAAPRQPVGRLHPAPAAAPPPAPQEPVELAARKQPAAPYAELVVSVRSLVRGRLLPTPPQQPFDSRRPTEPNSHAAPSGLVATASPVPDVAAARGTARHEPHQAQLGQRPETAATPDPAPAVTMAPVAAAATPPAAAGATPDSAAAPAPIAQPAATPARMLPADSAGPRPRQERPAYRLLLGVAGAPELTAVHLRELTRPGTTVGAVLEYRFSSRLRVRSGVFRSVKLYNADGADYRPPASYWTWRVPIDRIRADCRILEIPLDLRYELRQRPGYSLFASAGLSSLLMRNEQYTYYYTLNGQYQERTWNLARGSNHPLSVLSLSAGYERALGGRWAAQAEPFVKLPLGGVGFGNISLRSAGITFGLKYGLLASRPSSSF